MSEISWKFDHVHVLCSDLAASEKWFIEGMGGELVRRRLVRGNATTDIRMGGVLVFLRGRRPDESLGASGPSRFGTDHIGLMTDNLYEAAAELKRRGVEFEVEPYELSSGTHVAFVKGPDAVRIELLQRG